MASVAFRDGSAVRQAFLYQIRQGVSIVAAAKMLRIDKKSVLDYLAAGEVSTGDDDQRKMWLDVEEADGAFEAQMFQAMREGDDRGDNHWRKYEAVLVRKYPERYGTGDKRTVKSSGGKETNKANEVKAKKRKQTAELTAEIAAILAEVGAIQPGIPESSDTDPE